MKAIDKNFATVKQEITKAYTNIDRYEQILRDHPDLDVDRHIDARLGAGAKCIAKSLDRSV